MRCALFLYFTKWVLYENSKNTHTNTHNNQHEQRPPGSPAALPLCHHVGQGILAPKSSRRHSPTSGRRSRAIGVALTGAGSFVGAPKWHPIENERGGLRIDLNGRRSLLKHNNQMNDGVGGGGCVREEMRTSGTRGGAFTCQCGRRIE